MDTFEPLDTDMASPPSTFLAGHSQSHTSTVTTHSQLEASTSNTHTSSHPKKKTVPDGYIYQSYEDKKRSNDKSSVEQTQGQQASATRILELRGLERRIIQLLETAGEAIQILSGDQDEDEDDPEIGRRLMSATGQSREAQQAMIQAYADEKAKKFEVLASGYATLVNEIQSGLRRQFHYLTKAGIASAHVPFKNVLYGEEKELETWLNAVDVLNDSANSLIGKIEGELLDNPSQSEASTIP
ncbi:hypothetical protein CPB97_010733 [Podila verticillata]|nr:hypothetical protein CPB97_010733 [Podila verticillata]